MWQSLTWEVKGTHFRVFLNDTLLFEADDRTFRDAGKVGLWTKADSVTHFDDLTIRPSDTDRPPRDARRQALVTRRSSMTGRTMTDLGMALTMAVFTVFWSAGISFAGEGRLDTAAIERLTGAKGEFVEKEGVFKVSVPA